MGRSPASFFMHRRCASLKKRQISVEICRFFWRRRWDSNPRAILLATRFRVETVMTTSIHLHVSSANRERNYYSISFLKLQEVFEKTFQISVSLLFRQFSPEFLCRIMRARSQKVHALGGRLCYNNIDFQETVISYEDGGCHGREKNARN